jgi:hypothetical protein
VFCCFAGYDKGSFDGLVFEMERNLYCLVKTLHELCGSCLCKEIGKMISGKRGDEVIRRIFDAS